VPRLQKLPTLPIVADQTDHLASREVRDPPSDNDTYNVYELDISDPPQTYYLNSGTSGIDTVCLVDYLATIPMNAGAIVTLTANSIDGREVKVVAGP
jgi:hypothetical protein